MVNGSLPDGWTKESIRQVITKIPLTGRKLPQGEYLESGKYPVIDQGQTYIGGYTDDKDLLVPCELPVIVFGDHTKAIKYVNFPFVAGADGVKVIKPSSAFSPKLFYYFLQAIELPNKGYARHFQYLEKESIPLPPLPEQERIVAKIEELFTQLDAGTAALERVHAGLKRYKASVLKAAVEGKLGIQNDEFRMQDDGQLPAGWKWVTLGEITQHLTSGSRGWAKYYSEEGSLFVRVGNFNRLSNTIDLTKLQLVNAPDTAEANRTRLKKRDLLITMTADVGMVGIVDERTLRWGDAYINQHVGLVRLENPDYVDYVSWALASEIGQKQFRAKQYGLTKVGLNFDDIRSLEIPLPPLEEQRQIVAEVERRLSLAAEVESTLAASLSRAGRLRQSVLKSAFEGRLV